MKNKLLVSLSTIVFISLFSATTANAQTINLIDCTKFGPFSGLCNQSATNIPGIIGGLITFIFVISVVVALFYLIWGGFRWITSQGDKVNVENARNQIIAAVVGLIVLFLSFLIFNIILAFFNLNLGTLTIPTVP